jgi:outer membrane autotransporter protein
MDMLMNSVLSNASSGGYFSNGRVNVDSEKDTRKRIWLDTLYTEGDVDGDDGLGNFKYSLTSLVVGGDLSEFEEGELGAFFSYGNNEMDEHDAVTQNFSTDTYSAGLYLNDIGFGRWNIRSVLGLAYSDISSKRIVTLSTSSSESKANFKAHSAFIGVEGYTVAYKNDWVTLSPGLGLNYSYYQQETFSESGDADLSLKIDSASAQTIITSVGVNAIFKSLFESHAIYPTTFIRYEHDWYANANNEHEIQAALVSNPDFKQTFEGQNRGENTLITGLGLQSDIDSNLLLNGGLRYAVSTHGNEWGVGFGAEYYW